MSKYDISGGNNSISCGISDKPEVFHRKMADMLADGNDATTWTVARDQQEEHIKQFSNYGKEIKKENIVLARLELTYLVNSIVQTNRRMRSSE